MVIVLRWSLKEGLLYIYVYIVLLLQLAVPDRSYLRHDMVNILVRTHTYLLFSQVYAEKICCMYIEISYVCTLKIYRQYVL